MPAKKKTTKKKSAAKKAPAKQKASSPIDQMLSVLQEKHGEESIRRFSKDVRGAVTGVISSGIDVLDNYVLGCGGLPEGRSSEVYSNGPSAGKSTFGFHMLAQAQRQGGIAILADSEGGLDPDWAHDVHGLNMDDLLMIEADSIEHTTEWLLDTIASVPSGVGPVLAVWDSIAASPTSAEVNGLFDDEDDKNKERLGDKARHMSKFCRQVAGLLKPHRTHLMFVNQSRKKIGVMFGSPFVTPGGEAVKFYASHRLELAHTAAVKSKNDQVGSDVRFKCVKNKLSPPWREALVRLSYDIGWENEWSTLAHAMGKGVLPPRSRGVAAYEKAMTELGWAMKEAEL